MKCICIFMKNNWHKTPLLNIYILLPSQWKMLECFTKDDSRNTTTRPSKKRMEHLQMQCKNALQMQNKEDNKTKK